MVTRLVLSFLLGAVTAYAAPAAPLTTQVSRPSLDGQSLSATSPGPASVLVVTATTGNPPPVVTFEPSQNPSLKDITAKTTTEGTVFYPFGWFWAPVGEPPIVPTPPEATPPEPQTTKQPESCKSTTTPTVTIIVSYPTNEYGEYKTSIETRRPSNTQSSCIATETFMTTTAPYSDRQLYVFTGTLEPGPQPRDYSMTVTPELQKYLEDSFNSLGIGAADYAQPTATAQGVCAGNQYKDALPSAASFVKGLSPSFCKDWSAKPTEAFSRTYSAKDVKTNAARSLLDEAKTWLAMKRTPPPRPLTADSYPGWTIDFSWKPAKVSSRCSAKDHCENAMSSILSTCSGFTLADAYSGGNVTDECGQFSYSIHGYPDADNDFREEDVTCDLPTVNDIGSNHTPRSYPRDAYKAAAHQFCYGGYNWDADPQNTESWTATNYFWFDTAHYDNATDLPAYCVGAAFGNNDQISPKSAGICKDGPGLMHSNSKIWVQVVPSPSQESCKPLSKYKLPDGKACYDNMMHVVDKCMPKESGKVGVWKQATPTGCWDWWLWGRELT